MNPKSNTRSRYFGGNQPRRDKFRGFKGRVRKKQLHQSKQKPWQIMDEEIKDLRTKYSQVNSSKVKSFTDLPLSKKTLQGLKFAKYESPTDIQRESIGLALQGNDILGAAKTGSGKTLAFLIPVLENLFLQKWSALDGLGALIISPTRELAYQTFEVLKKLGKFHDFSAGLVIGGKLLKEESARINRTNIVICTPGRLLQHMDETVNFSADSLQILVLDEADRILDLGFAKDMNAIIENLPSERQTLLFSATQTKSVKDLARLSLKDPMFVSVHENAQHSTPSQLEQNYVVCELHDKISMLWSFVKNHLKSKVLVFMASCKQVKFVYEIFRHLRPGVSVMALHGGMHQLKRVAAYNQFCRKKHAVLFATDIAARGLDFPAVNWVVQLDCPEDANTYIHRAGRTARYEKDGESLLILLPSEEEAMVKQLTEKKIPIDKIKINMRKLWNIQPKLESSLAANPTLKDTAQRAFLGYLRSVFLMSNKQVFNIHKLNTDDFARSLGLAIPPKVRFLKREQKRLEEKEAKKLSAKLQSENVKNKTEDSESEGQESEDSESDTDSESENESDSDVEERIIDSDKIRQGAGSGSSDESDNDNSDNSDGQDSEESGSEGGGNVQSKSSPQKLKTEKSNNKKNNRTSKAKDDNVLTFHVDDDGDELFSVKRTILSSDSEESESEESSSKGDNLKNKKKEKQNTKFAVAKKLLKKNLKVNTKIVFDEEGNEVQDVMKKPQAVSKPDDYEGGIDLRAAKQRMLEEDKFDKQLYRERIKQKHKEERIKKKEKRRGKKKADTEEDEGEEAVAILDTGGEDDAMEVNSRIMDYGSSDTDQDDSDDDSPVKKMRRMEESVSLGSDTGDEDDDEDDDSSDEDDNDVDNDIDTGLALEDDEEIALRLLQG